MYIVLFILAVFLCLLVSAYVVKGDGSYLKCLLEANNIFCLQFFGISCFFMAFEIFEVWKTLIVIICINLCIYIYILLKKCKRRQIRKINKKEILIIFFLVCVFPFIRVSTEDIGTVSDQGGYFFYTVVLMEGMEKEIHSIPEFGKISDEVDMGLRELQEQLVIFYHESGEDFYYPHALRSWCSMPALFGKMFGIWNCMSSCQYLYILLVLNMFYLCNKIANTEYAKYLVIGLFATSPLILYIAKAGLTEIVLLYLVTLVFQYIMTKSIRYSDVLCGYGIGLMGFMHVSMYAYMPILTLILFSMSLKYKRFALINIIQMLMYGLSMFYVYTISPIYVERQFKRFLLGGRISYSVFACIIFVCIIALCFFQAFIAKSRNGFFIKIVDVVYERFRFISIPIITLMFIVAIYYAYYLGFTDKFAIPDGVDAGTWSLRNNYVNTGMKAVSHLNLINIARATGVIGLVYFLQIPYGKKKISRLTKCLYYFSLYTLIIFAVFQMDTPSNYYSSRYFVPFLVPLITITIVSHVDRKAWCIYIFFVACMYNIHFWPSFIQGGPQVGQYQMLQDVLECIGEEAIVLCDGESTNVNTRLTTNLRLINKAEVYNIANIEAVTNYCSDKNVYVLAGKEIPLDNFELIHEKVYASQYSFGNGINGTYDMSYGTYNIPIYIYRQKN